MANRIKSNTFTFKATYDSLDGMDVYVGESIVAPLSINNPGTPNAGEYLNFQYFVDADPNTGAIAGRIGRTRSIPGEDGNSDNYIISDVKLVVKFNRRDATDMTVLSEIINSDTSDSRHGTVSRLKRIESNNKGIPAYVGHGTEKYYNAADKGNKKPPASLFVSPGEYIYCKFTLEPRDKPKAYITLINATLTFTAKYVGFQ